jgi:DNA-binding transcriptional LysR family regulator
MMVGLRVGKSMSAACQFQEKTEYRDLTRYYFSICNNPLMDRIAAMQAFIAVAETGSFAVAARRLNLSAPSVTRAVAAIEERIGTLLLHRTTRQVRLTEAGQRYLMDCRRIVAEVEEAEAAAAGDHAEPRGSFSVTAPVMFGRIHVAPLLLDFLDAHPGVSARLALLDRVVDLMDEGFDVALRIAELEDSGLVAIKVGTMRRVICATPDYLARHGEPRKPADLAAHPVILTAPLVNLREWLLDDPEERGNLQRVVPQARLIVNSADVAVTGALAGRGLTRVLQYQIAPELRAGRLKIILPEYEPAPVPVHLVQLGGRRAPARVRAFVDFAAARLRHSLAEIAAI